MSGRVLCYAKTVSHLVSVSVICSNSVDLVSKFFAGNRSLGVFVFGRIEILRQNRTFTPKATIPNHKKTGKQFFDFAKTTFLFNVRSKSELTIPVNHLSVRRYFAVFRHVRYHVPVHGAFVFAATL